MDDNPTIFLKCKQCGIEIHMPLKEYLKKVMRNPRKPKIIRCTVCPDHPPLFWYKPDRAAVAAAGMEQERKNLGISEPEFNQMIDRAKPILAHHGIALPSPQNPQLPSK